MIESVNVSLGNSKSETSANVTKLPYAGPEVMGGEWGPTIKPAGARQRTNGNWQNYYNPAGATGPRKKKKEEDKPVESKEE